jgi:DNA-binding transcriptional LysR family regulator
MYPGVELRLLRYVAVLAQELNFTRASARLYVAQPSLSKQIRELEEYLGLKLFERTKRVVRLTAAGEAFVTEARQAIFHAERAVARAATSQHRGPWAIAYSPLVDLSIPSRIRRHLSRSYPSTEIRLVSAHTSEQTDRLLNGSLQAGLVLLPVREAGLTWQGFHRQELVLALAKGHRLADKAEIEIKDLEETPLVTLRGDLEPGLGEGLNRTLRIARIRPYIFHEATTQAEALEVASDRCLAALLMPSAQHSARDGIVFRSFPEKLLIAETGLAYVEESRSAILESLRTFLEETFELLPYRPAQSNEERTYQMGLFEREGQRGG